MQITFDEGYSFGMGAFETIAVQHGKAIFLDAHLKRLGESLSFLGVSTVVTKVRVEEYLNMHAMKDGVLKLMASEKNMLFSTRENHYTEVHYENGFELDYSSVLRNETSPLTYHKTFNYGDCILEKRKAAEMGVDELLFQNTRGEISEGCTTNIFFVRNGVLVTPAIECGLLNGIIRRYLCENEAVSEEHIHPSQVSEFSECFVTNSLLGIMPVIRLGEVYFQEQTVTRRLMNDYKKVVQKI